MRLRLTLSYQSVIVAFHRNIFICVRNFILIKFAWYCTGTALDICLFCTDLQHIQTVFAFSNFQYSCRLGSLQCMFCFLNSFKKYPFINKGCYVMLINYFMIVGLTPSYSRTLQSWMNCWWLQHCLSYIDDVWNERTDSFMWPPITG